MFKKFFAEIVPQFSDRTSGFSRVVKLGVRRGDGAPVSVVELLTEKPAEKTETKEKKEKKASKASSTTTKGTPKPKPKKERAAAKTKAGAQKSVTHSTKNK